MANARQSGITCPLFFLKTSCPNKVLVVLGNRATTNFEHCNLLAYSCALFQCICFARFHFLSRWLPGHCNSKIFVYWSKLKIICEQWILHYSLNVTLFLTSLSFVALPQESLLQDNSLTAQIHCIFSILMRTYQALQRGVHRQYT